MPDWTAVLRKMGKLRFSGAREHVILARQACTGAPDHCLGREAMAYGGHRDRCLPTAVVGPVLLCALRRLASICLKEVMARQPR